jgi:hypothetical protein
LEDYITDAAGLRAPAAVISRGHPADTNTSSPMCGNADSWFQSPARRVFGQGAVFHHRLPEGGMAADELVAQELMLNRFNRLIGEVIRGALARNSFQPWEAEILMDLDSCQFERRRRMEILRQYQKAVERQIAAGPGPPMKLSEFLAVRNRRREDSAKEAELA